MVAMASAVPVGIIALVVALAAGPYAQAMLTSGIISGPATIVVAAGASSGKAVRFAGVTPSGTPGPTATPGTTPPSSPTPTATAYTFDDEFDGASGSPPNPSLWSHDIGGAGWGNQELEYYTDSNANSYLDGQGHLVIEADRYTGTDYSCWYGRCTYTSARLLTANAFSQAYGHFEVRMEMPNLQAGLWPAFWMLGSNYSTVGWPQCGEIDVMENYGSDLIQGSLHGPVPASDTAANYNLTSANLNDWHTYAIDWSPTQVTFSAG